MADLRIEKHRVVEELDQWLTGAVWSQSADTVPGQPQPGTSDARAKAQAPSCPDDLAVDDIDQQIIDTLVKLRDRALLDVDPRSVDS